MSIIPREFYIRPDVTQIAKELLGMLLVSKYDGIITSGIITETEAYEGVTDKASHAYLGRRTRRTEIMYKMGGTSYIYLCYGIHSLFNIVTGEINIPHAVLIRSIHPVEGIEYMLRRTGKLQDNGNLGNGPGNVTRLLAIHYSQTGGDLTKKPEGIMENGIWLEYGNQTITPDKIKITSRIGVGYAGEDALLPYRFLIRK